MNRVDEAMGDREARRAARELREHYLLRASVPMLLRYRSAPVRSSLSFSSKFRCVEISYMVRPRLFILVHRRR